MWLLKLFFPQYYKSDMSKYGYPEVFLRVPSISRYRESAVHAKWLAKARVQSIMKKKLFLFPNLKADLPIHSSHGP